MDTRGATDYLKGLAIFAVLAGHYASYYAIDFHDRWLFNYASEFVSIFFIVSGIGLFFSLSRRQLFSGGGSSRKLLAFYARRALRIYPLYWLSLFITPFFLPEYQPHLHSASLHTLGIYLAFPLVAAPGIYWFIPALVQCYLAAPFFYALLRRVTLWPYLALTALATLLFFETTRHMSGIADLLQIDPQALMYRNFFLGNVLLMALGLTIPVIIRRYREDVSSLLLTTASLVLFLTSVYVVRFPDLLFSRSYFYLTPLFLWSGFLFCLFFIATLPPLPLERTIGAVGRSSYALYLFHRPVYALLALAGVITADSVASVIYTLLLMPLITAACYFLERGSLMMSDAVERRLIARRTPSRAGSRRIGETSAACPAED